MEYQDIISCAESAGWYILPHNILHFRHNNLCGGVTIRVHVTNLNIGVNVSIKIDNANRKIVVRDVDRDRLEKIFRDPARNIERQDRNLGGQNVADPRLRAARLRGENLRQRPLVAVDQIWQNIVNIPPVNPRRGGNIFDYNIVIRDADDRVDNDGLGWNLPLMPRGGNNQPRRVVQRVARPADRWPGAGHVFYERIFNAAGGRRAEQNVANDGKNVKEDKEDVSDDDGDQMMAEAVAKEEEAVGQVAKKKKVSFVEMYGKDVGDYVEKIKQEIDAKHKDDAPVDGKNPPFAAVRALFPPLAPVPPPGMAVGPDGKVAPQLELMREQLLREELRRENLLRDELRREELRRANLLRDELRREVVLRGKGGPGPNADGDDRW